MIDSFLTNEPCTSPYITGGNGGNLPDNPFSLNASHETSHEQEFFDAVQNHCIHGGTDLNGNNKLETYWDAAVDLADSIEP